MRTSLSHLPLDKQREILEILEIIKEEANPEKVILFGSHAKGDWVEDEYKEDGITYTYISDYDFLVVIKKNGTKEQAIISHIENRCEGYKNVVSPIVHDIDYINDGLKIGQYFFKEIIETGVLLFDTQKYAFLIPTSLSNEDKLARATNYFNRWYTQGSEYLIDAENAFNRDSLRNSMFYLNQAAECFYSTILLVFTGYKPKTHNLKKLRVYSKHLSLRIFDLFSDDNSEEMNPVVLFELLRRGYIDARYSSDFEVEKDQVEFLINRLLTLKSEVLDLSNKQLSVLSKKIV